MDKPIDIKSREFLGSLINKNLRVEIKDGRTFHGSFKCTDPDMNIVLNHVYEYRQPSRADLLQAAEGINISKAAVNLQQRSLSSVVIPGEHIVKIELEEFASQKRYRERAAA